MAAPPSHLCALASRVLNEISQVFSSTEDSNLDPLGVIVGEILQAKNSQIVVYGVGREGLMLKALSMRLFHLGLNARCVGDMNAPVIGHGDLFIASAGPGSFATVDALLAVANGAGARVLLLTAQVPSSASAATRFAHSVAVIPARTMANDTTGKNADCEDLLLPMGSVYEGALFVLFEIVVMELRTKLGESLETMRSRHTNLE